MDTFPPNSCLHGPNWKEFKCPSSWYIYSMDHYGTIKIMIWEFHNSLENVYDKILSFKKQHRKL